MSPSLVPVKKTRSKMLTLSHFAVLQMRRTFARTVLFINMSQDRRRAEPGVIASQPFGRPAAVGQLGKEQLQLNTVLAITEGRTGGGFGA